MSRIGKQIIALSDKIDTRIENNLVIVKGPKGELSQTISELISVNLEKDNNTKIIRVTTNTSTKKAQQLHGLSRTLINNMVIGVSQGFSKHLEIQGVGYRAQMDGRKLVLNVGYSHPVILDPPKDISIKVDNNTNLTISGIDKEMVGQIASKIRAIRPPEPYKGKGIRYKAEIVKKKIGKAGK